MSDMSDYLETMLGNVIFRTQAAWKPPAIYVALYTTLPAVPVVSRPSSIARPRMLLSGGPSSVDVSEFTDDEIAILLMQFQQVIIAERK